MRRSDEFPVLRGRFIRVVYLCLLVAPTRFIGYVWAYMKVNTLGQGKNTYVERAGSGSLAGGDRLRLGTLLGLVYLVSLSAGFWILTSINRPNWILPAGLMGAALSAATVYRLPEWALFRSPLRSAYSTRFASVLRLGYYTLLLVIFAHLTNSRVFFIDPFTRWSVFVYGQDMHIPHHLFPAIPHYRLRRLHELLKRNHEVYRDQVVETHGTIHNNQGRPTILDEMTRPHATIALNGCGTSRT